MGVVQIEQSELDLLRQERDTARTEAANEKAARESAERDRDEKVEAAEAAKTKAETEKAAAETAKADLEEQANQTTLRDKRWGELGEGFVAKLGDHTKGKLQTQAGSMSDEDWDNRLKEVEELTAVKRDAAKDGGTPPPPNDDTAQRSGLFTAEEIASAGASLGGGSGTDTAPTDTQRSSVVTSLAGAFKK